MGNRTLPLAQLEGVDVPVRIIESTRRKKSVSARLVDGVLNVRVPAGIDVDERNAHIRQLATRLARRQATETIDLLARARQLARRYDLPEPSSVVWSSRQHQRWGSCTPATGAIRVSDRLSDFPIWVLDYVLVHELAHLVTPRHDAEFHALVDRYPKAERAEGFLIAAAHGHVGSATGFSWTSDEDPAASDLP